MHFWYYYTKKAGNVNNFVFFAKLAYKISVKGCHKSDILGLVNKLFMIYNIIEFIWAEAARTY